MRKKIKKTSFIFFKIIVIFILLFIAMILLIKYKEYRWRNYVGYEVKRNAVYYKNKEPHNGQYWPLFRRFYWKDKLENADPESFIILKRKSYGKDKNNVYCQNKIVDDADATTFEFFTQPRLYAKDKNYIYKTGIECTIKIVSTDVSSFRFLDRGYSRDTRNIYYRGYQVFYADPDTFEFLGEKYGKYAKDKNHVYKEGKIMEYLDPKTFNP